MNEADIAEEAARAAGSILASAWRAGPRRVEHKGAVDLVTEVDLACEDAVRTVLRRHTPEIPVLGEEGGGPWEARTRWIVDPLDGTTNFVHGFPWFCVSVGLEVDGMARAGAVFDPIRGAMYRAQTGCGATCDGTRLAVSSVPDLDGALAATGFPYDRRERAAFYLRYVDAVLRRTQGLRRAGAAALDLAMVAAGHIDLYWEFNLKPWDLAAGRLLVLEAGGQVTGHDGGVLDARTPSPLATNGKVHRAMIDLLHEVTDHTVS
jgi:myo-inositol-1(or 4)-monophosphatase